MDRVLAFRRLLSTEMNMVGIIFFAAAALAASAPPAVVPAASAQQGSAISTQIIQDVCYSLATGAIPLKLSNCFSFDRSTEPAFRTATCAFLRDTGQLGDYDFGSYVACMRHILDM